MEKIPIFCPKYCHKVANMPALSAQANLSTFMFPFQYECKTS